MALEEIITLTEMKSGIITPDQVNELINIIRDEKDKAVKNVREMQRHWCTVSRIIACTENKECLDRFIQLDGLYFINGWLNDIQKCDVDMTESFMEESIVVLLQALEKLQMADNYEKLTSSGLGITLKSYLGHHSSVINDKIRMLLDSWNLHMNISSIETSLVDCAKVDDKCITFGHETSHSGSPDSLPSEDVKDVQNVQYGNEVTIAIPDHEDVKYGTSDTTSSNDLSMAQDSISISGQVNRDAKSGYTTIMNGSHSSSRREEGAGPLEQNGEVFADVNDKENGITNTSVEQLRNDETSLEQNDKVFTDVSNKENGIATTVEQSRDDVNALTDGGSLKISDAKDKEILTDAAEQDPVLVVSEGTDIPGHICSSLHEKILDGPTEKDLKSLPEEASFGKELLSLGEQPSGSDIMTAKFKDDLIAIEHSNVIAVVQETESNTRKEARLEFDLNGEIQSEDVDPSAVPNHESVCDMVDHYLTNQISKPASVHPSPGPIGSIKQNIPDFDLNMADDEDDVHSDNKTDDVIPVLVSSSHTSEESCVELGPRKSEQMEFDLNSLGDAPPSATWSKDRPPFEMKNTQRSPSPTSSSSSVQPSMWDVDLNKMFTVPNVPSDPQPYLRNSSVNLGGPCRVMKPANSTIFIMGTRVDVGRNESFLQSPLHPNGNMTGFQNLVPTSMNPSLPLQPFAYRPCMPITMVDSRVGSPVLPHMMSLAQRQPPYLMDSTVKSGFGRSSCSSFDLNMVYSYDAGKRNKLSPCLTKRKEPNSEWDMYQHGLKHHKPPQNT